MAKFSFSVLTASVLGIMLVLTMYFSNRQRIGHDKDMRTISNMLLITLGACIADPIVYYIAGLPGLGAKVIIYINGSWLFLANVCLGYSWVKFLTDHLHISFSGTRRKVHRAFMVVALVCLVINIFVPFVFSAPNNVYQREAAYGIFLAIALVYIIDSLVLYFRCRNKVGILKFFPVQIFLIPVMAGIVIQVLFYEMSVIWPSVAVALAGVMTALKNEVIYTDRLTGLYNRSYLDYIRQEIADRKETSLSGIMIDLNDFKQINDDYGHSVGDEALIEAAGIFNDAFSEYGVVTRYAGDELVALLNTTDEALVESLIAKANAAMDKRNAANTKVYRLSAAMGYAVFDFRDQSMDDFLKRIDQEMYRKKVDYYASHDRRKR